MSGPQVLAYLWPNPKRRPGVDWLGYHHGRRRIPSVQHEGKTMFDPVEVEKAVREHFKMKRR